MSLAERCLQDFSSAVRTGGQRYFFDGQVALLESPQGQLHAIVSGGAVYRVYLDWVFEPGELAVWCTCPFFDDKGLCKHIWATILAADQKGIGPKGRGRLDLVPTEPDDEDMDDDSWIDDDDFEEEDIDEPPRRGPKASNRSKGKKTPPKPKWQQQLTWAAADLEPDVVRPALSAKPQRAREVWYVLDALSDGNISKPVVLLFQREVRATGKFGKLKEFALRPTDVDRLVTGVDAEILRLLLGYHGIEDTYYSYAYSPRTSELALPKGAQQFLLPKLAATGHLARIRSAEVVQPEVDDLCPLAWDNGPPWQFRLDIARDDAKRQWVLSGQLYQEGGEMLPLETAVMIFKTGHRRL